MMSAHSFCVRRPQTITVRISKVISMVVGDLAIEPKGCEKNLKKARMISMHAHVNGKRMCYNLRHSVGMIRKTFVKSLCHYINTSIAMFSPSRTKRPQQASYYAQLMLILWFTNKQNKWQYKLVGDLVARCGSNGNSCRTVAGWAWKLRPSRCSTASSWTCQSKRHRWAWQFQLNVFAQTALGTVSLPTPNRQNALCR